MSNLRVSYQTLLQNSFFGGRHVISQSVIKNVRINSFIIISRLSMCIRVNVENRDSQLMDYQLTFEPSVL